MFISLPDLRSWRVAFVLVYAVHVPRYEKQAKTGGYLKGYDPARKFVPYFVGNLTLFGGAGGKNCVGLAAFAGRVEGGGAKMLAPLEAAF